MNTHLRVSRLVGVYGELDRAERRMIDEHLRACDACRQAWCDEQRVRAFLKGLPCVDPPAGLEARLLAIPAAAAGGGGGGGGTTWPGWPWLASLTAAVALVGGLSMATWGGDAPVAPPAGTARLVTAPAHGANPSPVARAARPPLALAAGDPDALAAGTGADPNARPAPLAVAPRAAAGDPSRPSAADAAASMAATGGGGLPAAVAVANASGEPSVHDPAPVRRGSPPARGDRAAPGNPPTAANVAPRAPTATAGAPALCADLSIRVFADVAGETADPVCPACDGRWTDADDARAAALGLRLPAGFQLAVYDATGRVRAESPSLAPDGARIDWSFGRVCGVAPLTVQVVGLPAVWAACPAAPGDALAIREPGPAALQLGLQPACPVAPPPATATPTPTASPAAPQTPTGTPDPLPTTAAPADPATAAPVATETEAAQRPPRATVLPVGGTAAPAEPSPGPPEPIGSPPATARPPDDPVPSATLAAIRFRPTPTPPPRGRPAPVPTKEGPGPMPPVPTPPIQPPAGQPG